MISTWWLIARSLYSTLAFRLKNLVLHKVLPSVCCESTAFVWHTNRPSVLQSVHWLMTSRDSAVSTHLSQNAREWENRWREPQSRVLFVLHLRLCVMICVLYFKLYLVCTLWHRLLSLCLSPASQLCGQRGLHNRRNDWRQRKWWGQETKNLKTEGSLLFTLFVGTHNYPLTPVILCESDTGTILGEAIQARFQEVLDPALQSVTLLDEGTVHHHNLSCFSLSMWMLVYIFDRRSVIIKAGPCS